MKKDIQFPDVTDIAVAVVQESGENDEYQWMVYLLNLKQEPIHNVLVATKGYGTKEGESVKTSILRHFFEQMGPNSYVRVEPLMDNLVGLSNEFWVSFYQGPTIFDKKYVFVAESILKENLVTIPVLGKKGVMIR